MDFSIIVLFVILIVVLIANVVGLYWFGWMLPPLVSGGGPYVPSRPERVDIMIAMAKLQPSDKTCDFGSGDGRVVIAAAKAGAGMNVGYEVHPGLVRSSRWNIKRAGVADKTKIFWKSMWKADVHDVTVMFLYQIPYAIGKIGRKLKEELPPGARIVSNGFILPDWEPVEQKENVRLYVKV